MTYYSCHCEERSDEAISSFRHVATLNPEEPNIVGVDLHVDTMSNFESEVTLLPHIW